MAHIIMYTPSKDNTHDSQDTLADNSNSNSNSNIPIAQPVYNNNNTYSLSLPNNTNSIINAKLHLRNADIASLSNASKSTSPLLLSPSPPASSQLPAGLSILEHLRQTSGRSDSSIGSVYSTQAQA